MAATKFPLEEVGYGVLGAGGCVFLYWAIKVILRPRTNPQSQITQPVFVQPPDLNNIQIVQDSLPKAVPNARLIIEPNKFADQGMV